MRYCRPMLIKLFIVNCLFVLCLSQSFDFFYFVQQWPPAKCDQKQSCCYPTTGKPALDFGIHGLWPNYNNGSYPESCDNTAHYDETEIEDLISSMQKNWPTLACPTNNGTKFWSHEWDKHGTCSLSTLDEHSYFKAALAIKEKVNLLSILKDAGIEPGGFYSLEAIKEAIKAGTGHEAGIECNKDALEGNAMKLLSLQPLVQLHSSRKDLSSLSRESAFSTYKWPGSFCETNRSCCFPSTGKPASNFSIHGLWPNYKNGSYPEFCNPSNPFNQTQISDLISRMKHIWPSLSCPNANNTRFWAHEWDKHGTCSESILNQHCYVEVTLNLKEKVNLLQILKNAGIQPDGRSYRLKRVEKAIRKGTGFTPVIECNVDPSGNSQLFEIYLCVNKSGSKFIRCPKPSKSSCNSTIEFPVF